jgi:homoserine dehydrogenase
MTKTLQLGIAGLGTVGAEVARQIIANHNHFIKQAGIPVMVTAVSARNADADRGFSMQGIQFCNNPLDLASMDNVDVVVELIGGSEGVALDLVQAAIANGKHVITANKALLAHHGYKLAVQAEKAGVMLAAEASVAGGIPVLKILRESLSGNQITRITGILNGTCNYILSIMQHQARDFDDVLAEAQALGYAEADPGFDIDGVDAGHKLALLGAIGFGTAPSIDAVDMTGVRAITMTDMENASNLGCTIRLLAEAEQNDDGEVLMRVRPVILPLDNQLAKIDGPLNAVTFTGSPIGAVTAIGPGAGAGATASAVLADIIDLALGRISPFFGVPADQLAAAPDRTAPQKPERVFIRLKVYDRPGVLADITTILKDHAISVESLLQSGRSDDGENGDVPVVLTTHEAAPQAIAAASAELAQLPAVLAEPVILTIGQD